MIHCLAIPRRDLSTNKTKSNIEKWPENEKALESVRILIYRTRAIHVSMIAVCMFYWLIGKWFEWIMIKQFWYLALRHDMKNWLCRSCRVFLISALVKYPPWSVHNFSYHNSAASNNKNCYGNYYNFYLILNTCLHYMKRDTFAN